MGTVVNREMPFLPEGSLEITLKHLTFRLEIFLTYEILIIALKLVVNVKFMREK